MYIIKWLKSRSEYIHKGTEIEYTSLFACVKENEQSLLSLNVTFREKVWSLCIIIWYINDSS